MYLGGVKLPTQQNLASGRYSASLNQAFLINGRSRFKDPATNLTIAAPLEQFSVRYLCHLSIFVNVLLYMIIKENATWTIKSFY